MAALLSGGLATWQVPLDPEKEIGISQVFLAFDVASFSDAANAGRVVQQIVEHFHEPSRDGTRARYPGERTLEMRRKNLAEGIPVDPSIWELVKTL
jgi:3-dehydro-L-gulonate 2-dehydrogenase